MDYNMRLLASDEDVYEMMDKKDEYRVGAVICGIFGGLVLGAAVTWFPIWDLFYLSAVSFSAAVFMIVKCIRCSWQITEMKQCYLEIDGNNLVVRQASDSAGHYLSGRIYLDEIKKIVEKSSRGVPGFYVILRNDASKSFFLLDDVRVKKNMIEISSFGYRHVLFQNFFRRLIRAVPEDVKVVSTGTQETWFLKRPRTGTMLLLLEIAAYAGIKVAVFLLQGG